MEDKNIIYNTKNKNIMPIDTSHDDFAMNAIQGKKELLEKMKQEALDAEQKSEEFYQQIRRDDIVRDIPNTDIPEGYRINEYGEIERPGRTI